MKISNVKVYGLEESIIASGYPMMTEQLSESEFDALATGLRLSKTLPEDIVPSELKEHSKRISKLAGAKAGSGHNCALKGVIVQYNLTAPEFFWRQFDRYHFHDYISSESKMHRILRFDIAQMCNKYVDLRIITILKEKIDKYNNLIESGANPKDISDLFHQIISNTPMGFQLTARITDNYLQLQSKYSQRKNHKLNDWKEYCKWIETLPMSYLITGKE